MLCPHVANMLRSKKTEQSNRINRVENQNYNQCVLTVSVNGVSTGDFTTCEIRESVNVTEKQTGSWRNQVTLNRNEVTLNRN